MAEEPSESVSLDNEATASSPNPSSLCAVCKEVSDNHHLHYGALCCFSCRAFFRRANQTLGKVYACKQDGKCDVSKKNRKKCQKCRYEACLAAGMDPGLVLTEEQKKARFRKMLEKKSDQVPSTQDSFTSGPTPVRAQEPHLRPASRHPAMDTIGSKVDCVDGFGGVKRRRITPPTYDTDQSDEPEEILRNSGEEANLDNFERLLPRYNQLQTDTLQEIEATLNLIQDTKRLSDIPYYMQQNYHNPKNYLQQQHHHQQQQQQQHPHFQRQGPMGFYLDQKGYQNQYSTHPAGPFEPVCDIKQEYVEGIKHIGYHPECYQDPGITDSLIEQLKSYFDGNENDVTVIKEDLDHDPLEKIMADFDKAAASTLAQENDLVQTLLNFHCNCGNISKLDARRLITCLAEQLRQFASSQTPFQSISCADQFRLLALTRPLFVHYILGQYFVNNTIGPKQVQWLVGEPRLTGLDISGADAKPISVFNEEVGLFIDPSVAEKYFSTAAAGLNSLLIMPRHNGIVAALLLFSPLSTSQSSMGDFDQPALIDSYEKSLLKLVIRSKFGSMFGLSQDSNGEPVMPPFIQVLHKLRDIFMEQALMDGDKRLASPPASSASIPKEMEVPPVSPEEEDWINKQLENFQSTYREVSLGDDFVKEYVMFSYDVPLSKNFASREYATFAERFKRILNLHDGFQDLSIQEQNAIWKSGCAKAMACCTARSACCTTGTNHLQFIFGDDDIRQWKENYSDSNATGSKVAKIKKVQMSDCNRVSKMFSSDEMIEYLRLVGSLGEMTTDEDIFKIVLLISLFSGDDLPESVIGFVSEMKNSYLKFLRRKLKYDRRTFSKICISLSDIDDLSKLLKKLDIQESRKHESN